MAVPKEAQITSVEARILLHGGAFALYSDGSFGFATSIRRQKSFAIANDFDFSGAVFDGDVDVVHVECGQY